MIRIDYVQEFVTLASCLNFTRASDELFITQPSLSRHISLLESELGVKLVERNTRNVYLTQAGAELYKDFSRLLDSYQSVLDHAKALSSGFRGHIRFCAPYYWIGNHVEPHVFRFSKLYPDIRIEMNVCSPMVGIDQLKKRKTDLAVGFSTDTVNSDLASREIGREQLCIVMSADHPLAGRTAVSIRDFTDDRFIILELDPSHLRLQATVQAMNSEFGVSPTRFIFTQNLSTMGLTIRETKGVSILMNCFGNLGRDYLVSVPLSDPGSLLPLYLFRRKDCENEAAKTFFDAVSPGGAVSDGGQAGDAAGPDVL